MEAVHLDYEHRAVCGAKQGYLHSNTDHVTCESCKEWSEANDVARALSAPLMTPGACVTAILLAYNSLRTSMSHPAFEDEECLEGDAFAEANEDMNARLCQEHREGRDV